MTYLDQGSSGVLITLLILVIGLMGTLRLKVRNMCVVTNVTRAGASVVIFFHGPKEGVVNGIALGISSSLANGTFIIITYLSALSDKLYKKVRSRSG